jgi:hypothetical protein
MPRYFLIHILFLTLVFAAPAYAADKSSGDNKTAGGMICRSVEGQHGVSCDALCAKAEMACTAIQSAHRNPPLACGNAIDDTIAPFPVCRCCAVERR